jgi:hypothetical protein
MPRLRVQAGVHALWGVLWAVCACGGSSSETPPPLEPDPRELEQPRTPPPGAASSEPSRAAPRPPISVPDTWGVPGAEPGARTRR